jgi:hypothetical protein
MTSVVSFPGISSGVVIASPAYLHGVYIDTTTSARASLMIFNKDELPASGDVPLISARVNYISSPLLDKNLLGKKGLFFSKGISFAISNRNDYLSFYSVAASDIAIYFFFA